MINHFFKVNLTNNHEPATSIGYVLEKNDIEKQNGHPSVNGMKSICEQLLEAGL